MKSKMLKIITVAMAAAMIACIGTGCTNNGTDGQESSKASVVSSKDESVSDSSEESKVESKEESNTETSEESKVESAEESNTEDSEESTTESADESTEGSETDLSGYAAFFGSWEYAVGSMYYAFEINDDGTATYRLADGSSAPAKWTVEAGKLCLRAAGGLETFDYVDNTLKDTETGRVYLKVDTLSVDTQTENDESVDTEAYASFFGSWEYEVGSMYYAFEINADGTATYRFTDGSSAPAKWSVENGKLCLRAAGGLETFDYVDNTLTDTENGHVYLKVDTLSIDR